MRRPDNPYRRKLLCGAIMLPVSAWASLKLPTPSASEGPFYPTPDMRFSDSDNDLVKISGLVKEAGGEVVQIGGRLLKDDGSPVSNARVEIWQCDVNGRYLHRGDYGRRERDSGFQGFGSDVTGSDGAFSFRTIKPVPYPGRTPHIHVKVWHNERRILTTQLYLPNHPENASDFLYQRIPKSQRAAVSLFFDSSPLPRAKVDLVV